MTHIQNKIEWCLKKAEKELEKDELHRGLVKIASSPQIARKHIEKAQHNLNAALFFHEHGYSDWSASAFFYCAYHNFLAILRKYGYESRNQECTLALIESLIEDGKISNDYKKYVDAYHESDLILIKEKLLSKIEKIVDPISKNTLRQLITEWLSKFPNIKPLNEIL